MRFSGRKHKPTSNKNEPWAQRYFTPQAAAQSTNDSGPGPQSFALSLPEKKSYNSEIAFVRRSVPMMQITADAINARDVFVTMYNTRQQRQAQELQTRDQFQLHIQTQQKKNQNQNKKLNQQYQQQQQQYQQQQEQTHGNSFRPINVTDRWNNASLATFCSGSTVHEFRTAPASAYCDSSCSSNTNGSGNNSGGLSSLVEARVVQKRNQRLDRKVSGILRISPPLPYPALIYGVLVTHGTMVYREICRRLAEDYPNIFSIEHAAGERKSWTNTCHYALSKSTVFMVLPVKRVSVESSGTNPASKKKKDDPHWGVVPEWQAYIDTNGEEILFQDARALEAFGSRAFPDLKGKRQSRTHGIKNSSQPAT